MSDAAAAAAARQPQLSRAWQQPAPAPHGRPHLAASWYSRRAFRSGGIITPSMRSTGLPPLNSTRVGSAAGAAGRGERQRWYWMQRSERRLRLLRRRQWQRSTAAVAAAAAVVPAAAEKQRQRQRQRQQWRQQRMRQASPHLQSGTARPGCCTSLRRQVEWAGAAWLQPHKNMQPHEACGLSGATPQLEPQPQRHRPCGAPESTLTKRTRFLRAGATSSRICPIIWQGLRAADMRGRTVGMCGGEKRALQRCKPQACDHMCTRAKQHASTAPVAQGTHPHHVA